MWTITWSMRCTRCFNEAAGIHRRKDATLERIYIPHDIASMRPPEFTGGKADTLGTELAADDMLQ